MQDCTEQDADAKSVRVVAAVSVVTVEAGAAAAEAAWFAADRLQNTWMIGDLPQNDQNVGSDGRCHSCLHVNV